MACNKTIETADIQPYTPLNNDVNAGIWKTYIVKSPSEILLAAPNEINSEAYKNELDSLKTKVLPNLTNDQTAAVAYWSVGAVYRWNEIARELAAKYNLPPKADENGKYPVPDAANPLNYPQFPFANPPYTARMLAYLGVAQNDALVAAWHYKYKFNRAAPSLNAVYGTTNIPSYPSTESTVAEASYAILLAMFPGEGPYLSKKLDEARNIGMWAGKNVLSDVNAGASLGKAVAAKILAVAKTDGMAAANNQSLVSNQTLAAKARGIINPWVSQEIPLRPPMLPNYGAVNTWNLTRSNLVAIRPQLPYIEGSEKFLAELDELKSIQNNQTREQARIANYWADGAGSYTPPGHWLRMAANDAFDAKISEVRMARTLALVATAVMDAGIGCWDTKYFITRLGLSSLCENSVGLPNFPSYTSGHSTFSAAAATVLSYVFPANKSKYETQASEASNSRVYGLIHFRGGL